MREKGKWTCTIRLSNRCLGELISWKTYLESDIVKSLYVMPPTVTIFTDASLNGFAGVWGDEKFQGLFTEKQRLLSINSKELLAIYYTLSVFAERLVNERVHLRCDNMTALYCIKNFGSRDILRDQIVRKVFYLAHKYSFTISISYVQSSDNISDESSRKFKNKSVHTEWTLDKNDFVMAVSKAEVPPNIDLFASAVNTQLSKFVSWTPHMKAFHIDAFTLNWYDLKGYIFCPFSCVSSILKKCLDDRIKHYCGVFPLWQTKTWWPTLMQLCGNKYTLLKGAGRRLHLPWDPDRRITHPMGKRLNLIFVNLSMKYYSVERSLKHRQLIFPKMPGITAQSTRGNRSSKDGSVSQKRKT